MKFQPRRNNFRKKKNLKSLGGLFHSFLPQGYRVPAKKKNNSSSGEFEFLDLHMNWENIAGEKLGKHTRPQKIRRDCLIIMTSHSQYAHYLVQLEQAILEKIFSLYPSLKSKIKKLRFEQNEAFFKENDFNESNMTKSRQYKETSQKYHPMSPAYKQIKAQADLEFAEVDDEEMKNDLIKLFIQNRMN